MTWIHLNVSHLRKYGVIRIDKTYEWKLPPHGFIIHLGRNRSRFGTDGKTWWRCFSSFWHLAVLVASVMYQAAVFSQLAAKKTSSKEFRTQPILKAPEASDIEHFIWRSCINYPSPKVQISSFFFTTGRCSGASTRRWCRSGQDQGFFPNVKVVVVGPCEFIRWGWITP